MVYGRLIPTTPDWDWNSTRLSHSGNTLCYVNIISKHTTGVTYVSQPPHTFCLFLSNLYHHLARDPGMSLESLMVDTRFSEYDMVGDCHVALAPLNDVKRRQAATPSRGIINNRGESTVTRVNRVLPFAESTICYWLRIPFLLLAVYAGISTRRDLYL